MKQVMQHLRSGTLELLEVPCPKVAPGHLLIRNRASVISAGTERMLVEFARGSMIQKARQQPERVRQVIDKIKTDGLWATTEAIGDRLDQPLALGYSSCGEVIEVGEGVDGFSIGERVASNGPHAEVVHVPKHLCAKVPDDVADEPAAFAVLAAVPLQGIRLLRPELGETIVVYGLGLLGLLAVQILRASGVKVIGIDFKRDRLDLAAQLGATVVDVSSKAVVQSCDALTNGVGVDGVLITANAQNDDIIRQSASISRRRGRIVLVGVVEPKFDRKDFYDKELTFQVSCSYGPGRYDPAYEKQGIDYPIGHVRWTQQRNIAAVVDLLARGDLKPETLITQRVAHANAEQAYDSLAGDESQLAIVLQYPSSNPAAELRVVRVASQQRREGKAVVGFVGAGDFARRTLLPAFQRTDARLKSIVSAGGVNAAVLARKFGVEAALTESEALLDDDAINTIVIATRHDQHAELAAKALRSGKHVFVEKPLAIDQEGLALIREAYESVTGQQLMVGFNRRFSPLSIQMRDLLKTLSQPASAIVTVNAGQLPAEHWLHDPQIGGGRIIGEACHWIDLLCFLFDSSITDVHAIAPTNQQTADQATISLKFTNGSIGTVHYLSSGHRGYPKERIDVFCEGKTLTLDNFRRLTGKGWSKFRGKGLVRQDKGHRAEIQTFVECINNGGPPLVAPQNLWNVTEATFAAVASLHTKQSQSIRDA